MDATELRALADALEPMARAPRFKDMNVPAFCKWLRAQAEAQPVANLYYATSPHGGRRLAIADPLSPQMGQFAVYAHPAPASPQAEPKRDERVIVRRAIAERLRALPKFEERGR